MSITVDYYHHMLFHGLFSWSFLFSSGNPSFNFIYDSAIIRLCHFAWNAQLFVPQASKHGT